MRIVNKDSSERSWFAYNYEDTSQGIALASGPLTSDKTKDWDPPSNGSGYYTVLIKRNGSGGSVMAGGSGRSGSTFTFNGHTLVVT